MNPHRGGKRTHKHSETAANLIVSRYVVTQSIDESRAYGVHPCTVFMQYDLNFSRKGDTLSFCVCLFIRLVIF